MGRISLPTAVSIHVITMSQGPIGHELVKLARLHMPAARRRPSPPRATQPSFPETRLRGCALLSPDSRTFGTIGSTLGLARCTTAFCPIPVLAPLWAHWYGDDHMPQSTALKACLGSQTKSCLNEPQGIRHFQGSSRPKWCWNFHPPQFKRNMQVEVRCADAICARWAE